MKTYSVIKGDFENYLVRIFETDKDPVYKLMTFEDLRNADGKVYGIDKNGNVLSSVEVSIIQDVAKYSKKAVSIVNLKFGNIKNLMTKSLVNGDKYWVRLSRNCCAHIIDLDASRARVDLYTNSRFKACECAFANLTKLEEVDIGILDCLDVKSIKQMFSYCKMLTTIKGFDNLDLRHTNDIDALFCHTNIEYLKFKDHMLDNVDTIDNLCVRCENLKYIDMGVQDCKNLRSAVGAFADCIGLKELELNGMNLSGLTGASYFVSGCVNLKVLDMSRTRANNIEYAGRMIQECTRLETVIFGNITFSKAKNMSEMFSCCIRLKKIYINKWDTENVLATNGMFLNCDKLEDANLSTFKFTRLKENRGMFKDMNEDYCEREKDIIDKILKAV